MSAFQTRGRIAASAASLMAVIATAGAASAQSLTNAGFETPSVGAGNSQANPAGAAWSFTGNSGIAANGATILGGLTATEGTQVAYIQKTSTISQTLSFATAGTVVFTFDAAQLPVGTPATQLSVTLNGIQIGLITPTGTFVNYSTNSPVTIIGGSYVLSFNSTNAGAAGQTVFLDNVKVSFVADGAAAPEPGSAALLATGALSLMGGVAVRRRRLS